LKKRNSLRDSDWTERALVTPQRTAQQVINNIPPNTQTALVDNAAIISKQAKKYSTQCGLIVLCNYQDMIVLDFKPGPGPGSQDSNDLTNPVQYFFSSGNPQTGLTHKQLLTAALIHGMRKAGFMGPNGERSQSHNLRH